jgi:hypothetical protein
VGTAALGCSRAKPVAVSADNPVEEDISTRSSIWLGKSEGKHVHIYWELAERESDEKTLRAACLYRSRCGRHGRRDRDPLA